MASCLPKLADTIWLFLVNLWLCQLQKIFQLYSSLLWHTICTVPFWEKFPKISGKRQILRSLESFLLLDHPETRPFYATLGMTKIFLEMNHFLKIKILELLKVELMFSINDKKVKFCPEIWKTLRKMDFWNVNFNSLANPKKSFRKQSHIFTNSNEVILKKCL